MKNESALYFECHVTIEPVFDDPCETCDGCTIVPPGRACPDCDDGLCKNNLNEVKHIAELHGFRVADLLMQKRKSDSQERSKFDTFMTSRSVFYDKLYERMTNVITELQSAGYKVWRYKIEDTIIDSKFVDGLGILR